MKKLLVVMLLAAITLTGCAEERQLVISAERPVTDALKAERTGEFVEVGGSPVFSGTELIPVLDNGVMIAKLRINQIEKLGIWDWNNQEAVKNSIKYSYSINYTVFPTEALKGKTLTVKPYLRCGSLTTGTPCLVGWNGFEDEVNFYKLEEAWAEIGLQPLYEEKEDSVLSLTIEVDNRNVTSIDLDATVLAEAKEGPSLLTENDKVSVKSVNGAKFKLWIDAAHKETHKSKLLKGSNVFYDFCYKLKYTKKPTSDKVVGMFGKDDDMVSRLVVAVQSNVDDGWLREELQDNSVERQLWSDFSTTGAYLTKRYPELKKGETATIWQNRKVQDVTSATQLRFSFEFPEETAVRSKEELLEFDGRYVVFQEKITDRKMKERE